MGLHLNPIKHLNFIRALFKESNQHSVSPVELSLQYFMGVWDFL